MATSSYSYSSSQYPHAQFGNIIQVGDTNQTGSSSIRGSMQLTGGVTIGTTINNNYFCKMVKNTSNAASSGFYTQVIGLSPGNVSGFDNALTNMCDTINSRIVFQVTGRYLITARVTAPAGSTTIAIFRNSEVLPIAFNTSSAATCLYISVPYYFTVNDYIELYVANTASLNVGGTSEYDYIVLSAILLN